MSTTIEWTDKVWNPTTGCNKVSRGCKNCYAEKMHKRLTGMRIAGYGRPFLDGAYPNPEALNRPLGWKKGKRVFVNSMSDLFHENIPFEYVDQVFAVMALTPQHTYQILTKRPVRMEEYMNRRMISRAWSPSRKDSDIRFKYKTPADNVYAIARGMKGRDAAPNLIWPLPNVWLGTSVEDQKSADERIPHLLNCPAPVRFLSMEPLVGPVNFDAVPVSVPFKSWYHGLGWVIVGGESGSKATPIHPEWVRSLRDQCAHAGVPFFFKQWGEWCPPEEYSFATGSPDLTSCKRFAFPDGQEMYKVGKHHSGRALDRKEHNKCPNAK